MTEQQRKELVTFRINKALDTLHEIEIHFQNELWGTAVNRLYYACFYAVSAQLTSRDLHSKTHSGTKQVFGLNFIKTGIITEKSGDYYTQIFGLRQTSDYDDFVVFEKDDVLALLPPARALVAEIEQILFV